MQHGGGGDPCGDRFQLVSPLRKRGMHRVHLPTSVILFSAHGSCHDQITRAVLYLDGCASHRSQQIVRTNLGGDGFDTTRTPESHYTWASSTAVLIVLFLNDDIKLLNFQSSGLVGDKSTVRDELS